MSAATIIFHGEPGWRFAFVENFTIREVADGFDVFQDCDGDDVRIACTDTLDEAVLFVYMKRGGGHVRIGEMVDTVDEALALIADNEGVGA